MTALALLSLTLGQSCDMPIVDAGDDDTEVLGYLPPKPPDDLTNDPETNLPPIVELDGTASSDPEDDALTFAWTQISGPDVTLNSATNSVARFVAPAPEDTVQLVFSLTVSDGVSESTDTVTVEVEPLLEAATVEMNVAGPGLLGAYFYNDGSDEPA